MSSQKHPTDSVEQWTERVDSGKISREYHLAVLIEAVDYLHLTPSVLKKTILTEIWAIRRHHDHIHFSGLCSASSNPSEIGAWANQDTLPSRMRQAIQQYDQILRLIEAVGFEISSALAAIRDTRGGGNFEAFRTLAKKSVDLLDLVWAVQRETGTIG